MARSVADAALLLSVIAGPDRRCPVALDDPGSLFARPLDRDFSGVRVAWWKDLGGVPVDARVATVVNAQRRVFESLGCSVEEAEPDFGDADEIFKTLRAAAFLASYRDIVSQHRRQVKDTILWEIDRGERLTAADIGRAEARRLELCRRVRELMERFEFFVLPVTQVPPFDVREPYVREIEGIAMETYIDWMKSCYYISTIGHPAVSVPAGFTPEGLPVGIQIVARHRDDWGLLQMAHAFEQASAASRTTVIHGQT